MREIGDTNNQHNTAKNDENSNISDKTDSGGVAETGNLFLFNQMKNFKDKDLLEYKRRVKELEELLRDSETNSQLHLEQIKTLKEEIRDLERSATRDNGNLEYLKNVVVKYIESGDDVS